MTTILGINAYHGDAAAALVVDGKLVAAVEEERFNRVKHWAGFPAESIRWCLDFAGVKPEELDHVAVSFDPKANFSRRLAFVARNRPSLGAIVDRVRRQGKTLGMREQLAASLGLAPEKLRAQLHRVEHHQAHVAAGFLISPYEESAVLSVDGMGDFTSTLTAHGRGTAWEELHRVWFPHSIGFLYTAVTMWLGFPYYGDEYKVMGLAPYGEPEYADFFRKMIFPKGDGFALNLDYFTHHKRGVKMEWNDGAPMIAPFYSDKLVRELGPVRSKGEELNQRHDNIAKSLQVVTEEIIVHLLGRLHARTGCKRVCLTGGVAMNSVANGKVTQQTPFEEVYVPAGAADNGTSFGAAFYVWNRVLGKERSFVQDHAYWGCESSNEECLQAVESAAPTHEAQGMRHKVDAAAESAGHEHGGRQECLPSIVYEVIADVEALLERVVDELVAGKVVGWFQGRMEFGARALGNRSLIADPRRTDMRDIINLKIKFREKFRPFAPSILEEEAGAWFEGVVPTPYMERVLPIREEKRALIPAVTHVDGSGRLQTVSRRTNPRYHALITKFFERTGVPIILNTSLNENEPVVRTPQEALACFLRTAMDVLVIGNVVVRRREGSMEA